MSAAEMSLSKRTFDEFHTADSATSAAERKVNAECEPPLKQRKTEARDDSSEPQAHRVDSEDDPLVPLLDFTQLETQSAISARFSEIAETLLHQYRIEITTFAKVEQLELLEIEFYLYKLGCHEDPFTHGSAEQSQAGRWYFHRPPSRSNEVGTPTAFASGYRGGTRKGLDITIGHPGALAVTSKYFSDGTSGSDSASSPSTATNTLRGGILLRSIRRLSDSKVISGPSLLVDEILRLSGTSKISDLPSPPPPSRGSAMRLVRVPPAPANPSHTGTTESVEKPRIYRSPRIGLDISHPSISLQNLRTHPRVLFVGQPYRFFIHPHLLTANGRGQTFLGVYDAEEAAGTHATYSLEMWKALERATGWRFLTVKNCFAEYRTGVEGAYDDYGKPVEEVLGQWLGTKGKGISGSMTGWLRMMGTLRRFLSSSNPEEAAAIAEGGEK
ncbi:hypothetical protein C8T65DRAFT_740787 [Cerioporus squamosus]|nr:hypothetical protein C8T65DRAFT_740787 [Cerioporus squamosus]